MVSDPVLRRIKGLDPENDWAEIYRLHAAEAFPFDLFRSLELALFRTYCVPSVGLLLDQTQEFEQRTQKRYDDTVLLLATAFERGLASPAGRAAVKQVNRIHQRFDISNEDMRYVLSTFVVIPIRWLDRYGWRPLHEHERVATNRYYYELGTLMGIKDIPKTWQAMSALMDDYEREHLAYSDASRHVGIATRELFVRWFPHVPASLIRTSVHALLDEPTRAAMGLPAAPSLVRRAVDLGLLLRGKAMALVPPRGTPFTAEGSWFVRSYPDGVDIATLGPAGDRLPGATQPVAREVSAVPS